MENHYHLPLRISNYKNKINENRSVNKFLKTLLETLSPRLA